MTNFVNLLNSVEKLAYEIIMWVIFVPKTILKVITNPDWVPGYIEAELKEEQEERFTDYMSPTVLLLAITLGMIAIITSINPSSMQISGPRQGVTDEPYEFKVMISFIWENQDILSYGFYEFDDNKDEGPPFYYYEEREIIQKEEWKLYKAAESDIIYENLSFGEEQGEYIVTFRFPDVREYFFAIEVENTMGEIIRAEHYINIQNTPEPSEPQPESQKPIDFNEETALVISLLALSFPLVFTFFIEINKNTPIDREEFQATFYIQCMYSSPVYLALLLLIISYLYKTPGRVTAFGGLNLSVYFFWLSLSLWAVISIRHLIVEVKYFSDKLDDVQKPKATVMVIGLLVVYYSILFGAKFLLENYGNTPFFTSILFSLVIVVGVPLFKRYSKKQEQKADN